LIPSTQTVKLNIGFEYSLVESCLDDYQNLPTFAKSIIELLYYMSSASTGIHHDVGLVEIEF